MNNLIKPENIRIYRKTGGTYTTRPEGKYVRCLSHYDRLSSLTVSVYPSATKAKEVIDSTLPVALPEKLPVYLAFEVKGSHQKEFIPGINRVTITVEDIAYLGFQLGTVSIIGLNTSQRLRDKLTYEDFIPRATAPIHHQALAALDDFSRNLEESSKSETYRDSFGSLSPVLAQR